MIKHVVVYSLFLSGMLIWLWFTTESHIEFAAFVIGMATGALLWRSFTRV